MFSSAVVFAFVLALAEVTGKVSRIKKSDDNSVQTFSPSTTDSGSSSNSDENTCNAVVTAVLQNARWLFNPDENTLQRIEGPKATGPVPTCKCPMTGGLGDVSKIVVVDSPEAGDIGTDVVCTGCPGNEIMVNDIKFCANPLNKNVKDLCINPVGPCSGITVFRCDCAALITIEDPLETTTKTYE